MGQGASVCCKSVTSYFISAPGLISSQGVDAMAVGVIAFGSIVAVAFCLGSLRSVGNSLSVGECLSFGGCLPVEGCLPLGSFLSVGSCLPVGSCLYGGGF